MLYIQNQSEQRLKLISGRQLVAVDPGKYVQIADNQADQGQLGQLQSLGLIQIFNRQFAQDDPPPSPTSPPILAAGTDTQVQYNAGGILAGSSGLLFDYSSSTLTATNLAGSGSGLTNLNASNLLSGIAPTGVLGSGIAGPGTFLHGDSSWSSDGSALSNLNASGLSFGLVQPALLGSGAADTTTFLRGDSTWVALGTFVAGLETQVQYNAGGVLAGSAALTFNNTSSTLTVANLAGSGTGLTNLNANNLSVGTVNVARLGSGTASADTFLRGDGSWAAPGNLAAGSDTQVQYNAAGVLTGSPGLAYNYSAHTLTVANLVGSGTGITNLNANSLSFGTVGAARLGTGTASGTTFLRGDGTWAAPTVVATPAGSDTQVQYNSGGVLSADSGLIYSHLTGTLTATNLVGSGTGLTGLNASNLTSGKVPTAQLGTGTATANTHLLGNNTWSTDGSFLTALNAASLSSGTVGVVRLGSGSASSSTFLRGDSSWATPVVAPAGSTTQVQYNSAGVLTGSAALTFVVGTGTLSATLFSGSGASLTALNASNLSSGTVGAARLGTGSASANTHLLGNNTWSTDGSFLTALNASNLTTGTVGTARLGTGTASGTTFLRGDGTWDTPTGGGSTNPAGLDTQVQFNEAGGFGASAGLVYDYGTDTLTATNLAGSGTAITALDASNLSSGTVPTGVLGSGTASSSTFLRGDNSWATPAGGSGTTTSYGPGASKPAAGNAGNVYVANDGVITSLDTGSAWVGLNPFGTQFTIPPVLSAWTTTTDGTNGYTTDIPGGGITLGGPFVAATGYAKILRSLSSSTSYTVTVALNAIFCNGTFSFGGIVLSDGSQLVTFGFDGRSGGKAWSIITYSGTGFSGLSSVQTVPYGLLSPTFWLRIQNDGTHRTYYVSQDGVTFTQIYQQAFNTLITETTAGVFILQAANNAPVSINALSWAGA